LGAGLRFPSHPLSQLFLALVAVELWTSTTSDLPLLFGGSPKVGLGLYNSISAIEATALEFGMFILGGAVYAMYVFKKRKTGGSHPA